MGARVVFLSEVRPPSRNRQVKTRQGNRWYASSSRRLLKHHGAAPHSLQREGLGAHRGGEGVRNVVGADACGRKTREGGGGFWGQVISQTLAGDNGDNFRTVTSTSPGGTRGLDREREGEGGLPPA